MATLFEYVTRSRASLAIPLPVDFRVDCGGDAVCDIVTDRLCRRCPEQAIDDLVRMSGNAPNVTPACFYPTPPPPQFGDDRHRSVELAVIVFVTLY